MKSPYARLMKRSTEPSATAIKSRAVGGATSSKEIPPGTHHVGCLWTGQITKRLRIQALVIISGCREQGVGKRKDTESDASRGCREMNPETGVLRKIAG